MKRVMTVVFALMIGLTLSMPAWAQGGTPAKQAQPAATGKTDKQKKKEAAKAKKEAAKKKKSAEAAKNTKK
jgi:hypothetical protein